MTLYHGSDVIVTSPLTGVGRQELDFGPGFYVTKLFEQAERWSRRICVIRAADSPFVSEYLFDEMALPKDIQWLRLEQYDRKWLDFVVASRRGERPWKNYDIIEGGVANDNVIDTVEDYFSGRITAEQAIGELRFAKPTHQLCLRNQVIADTCLRFVKSHPLKNAEDNK